ncbi:proteinase-activated receptor 3 [Polypterus senegalus]|uniref:proteinase-activated receptor 3 n=1 Tax=Polypterus senegalus TaxID=55291 RepID=UPI0019639EC4|nr:proteinase-activated receptor 3 [Polypterus senegalus]
MKKFLILVGILLFLELILCCGEDKAFPDLRTFKGIQGSASQTRNLKKQDKNVLCLQNNRTMQYFKSKLSTQIIPAVYIILVIIGIPSNVAVLWKLLLTTRKFSTATLYFSLAISDLLFLVMLTFKIYYHLNVNDWTLGEWMCKLVTACFYGNTYCSILNLMCISINRYVAIVHPFTYKSLQKKTCVTCSCLLVWITFFAATIPIFYMKQSYFIKPLKISTCHDVLPHDKGDLLKLLYFVLLPVGGFFIPLCVTTFCYISLIRELSKSDEKWFHYVKTMTLVFIIFLICFTPSNIILVSHYIQLYKTENEDFYVFYNVAACLCCIHSCLDPFLYYFMPKSSHSNVYRTLFKGATPSVTT